MTLLHQAAQQAVEALTLVTTSETFYRDPRGDRAGPAIDALVSALQHQEEPREPVSDAAIFAIAGSLGWCRLIDEEYRRSMDLPAGSRWSNSMTADDVLLFARALLAASPSTTRQQEVGSEPYCTHGYKRGRDFCPYCDVAAAPSTPEKAGGVPVVRTYLHASRVDTLIAVMEGECDGLAVTRETAEAILHYLDGNAPPDGVSAVAPVRLVEGPPRDFGQAQDRYGEHMDRPAPGVGGNDAG